MDSYAGWEEQALPLGNGTIGNKVFGFIGRERIQYNEKSLWSGGPMPQSTTYNGGNYQNKYKIIPRIQQALEVGDLETAKYLAEHHLVGPNCEEYGCYLAFGDIQLNFINQSTCMEVTTNYQRLLDLNTAIVEVTYTQDHTIYKRETFVSYPDNVSVTHLTSQGDKRMDFDVFMNMTTDLVTGNCYNDQVSNYKEGSVTYSSEGILLKGKVKNNLLNFAAFLSIDTDGQLRVMSDCLSIENASYATIYMNAQTDFAQKPKTNYRKVNFDVERSAKEVVQAAIKKGYQVVRLNHIEDYQSLFHRVQLKLTDRYSEKTTDELLKTYTKTDGQQLEELFYQYGRYLLISSSRDMPNALPANLQGIWNAIDNPAWNSDYHLNVNLQMNYWLAYHTNLAETAIPLINFVDDLRYYGRIAAKEYANIKSENSEENGWLVHTQVTPFGWTTPGWSYYWGWSPASNAWIMQNIYEYYRFTQNKQYLNDKIYPMLKETVKFWNQFLHFDAMANRWVSSPSYSPEHGTITIGNTFDQSLIWQLFYDFKEATDELKEYSDYVIDTELLIQIEEKMTRLKPLHINQAGRIKEWYEEDTPIFTGEKVEIGHRHVSELVGLFPGTLFSRVYPEYLEAAKATLNHRGDGGTGWSKANKINLWARLLDGNRAHKLLSELLTESTLTNLWDTHPPFQIDGNFGATSGMTEMLLQSHNDSIALLPALPDAWVNGAVSGLIARGNYQVDMVWKDKRLTQAIIISNCGGTVYIDYPRMDEASIMMNERMIKYTNIQQGRIELSTNKGDKIVFKW